MQESRFEIVAKDEETARYKAWLGKPKWDCSKPIDTLSISDKYDFGTDCFETEEETIQEVRRSCKNIIKRSEYKFYGRNW